MTAITKTWTDIAAGAVDPDSPLTTGLITALRDNAIYVREWLGAGFYAGAIQDHNHDGSNSARVDVGPNFLRNPSFEDGEAGWTFTNYTGGSHAISTSQHRHGAKAAAFTSTSTANGGGEALSNEFIPIAQGQTYSFSAWIWASTTNVSSKLQVVYYDSAQSSVSTVDLVTSTNTATSATRVTARDTAPSNARFCRIKCIGGVPASGSSTGTVYFDGLAVGLGVFQLALEASAVGQAELKTTTGDVTSNSTSGTVLTLPGGEYGFWPTLFSESGGTNTSMDPTTTSASPVALIKLSTSNVSLDASARQRYIQASPPYDLGDGEMPLFLFIAVDANGVPMHSYVAADPPWANNGPTNIRPDFYRNGIGWQLRRRPRLPASMLRQGAQQRDDWLRALREAPLEEVPVTQALKQADMPLIPHPFLYAMDGVAAVLMIDVRRNPALLELHEAGERLIGLVRRGLLRLDNTPLDTIAPPGVQAARATFTNDGA